MQENDFNDSGAIILSLHHGGSINAQNDQNTQTNLLLGVGCFGFLSRSLLLLPLCWGRFIRLQIDVGMKNKLENDFDDTNVMVPCPGIIAGSIDAEECFMRKKDLASWRWLLPRLVCFARRARPLSFVHGLVPLPTSTCWDEAPAR